MTLGEAKKMIDFRTMRRLLVLLAAVVCASSCTNNQRITVELVIEQLADCSGMGCTLESIITSNTTRIVIHDLQDAKGTFAYSPNDCRLHEGRLIEQGPIAALNFVSNGIPVAVLEVIVLFGKTNVQIVAWSPTTNWFVSTDAQLIGELLQIEPIRLKR